MGEGIVGGNGPVQPTEADRINVSAEDFIRCPHCGNWHPRFMACNLLPQMPPQEYAQRIINLTFELIDTQKRVFALEQKLAAEEALRDQRRRDSERPAVGGADKRSSALIQTGADVAQSTRDGTGREGPGREHPEENPEDAEGYRP